MLSAIVFEFIFCEIFLHIHHVHKGKLIFYFIIHIFYAALLYSNSRANFLYLLTNKESKVFSPFYVQKYPCVTLGEKKTTNIIKC
jgi:hypothetical protein